MYNEEYIDSILNKTLIEVGSLKLNDILSFYKVSAFPLPEGSILLNEIGACYIRSGNSAVIWYSDKLANKDFAIAHEFAHMILHDDKKEYCYYNPLSNRLKEEKEANYFATKLLYKDIQIEDGIETKEQLAKYLMIEESCVDYIVNKD